MRDHRHIQLMGTTTLGPKGQVVIPAEAREKMGLKPGDKLLALYLDDKKAIGFISESSAERLIQKLGEHVKSLSSLFKNK